MGLVPGVCVYGALYGTLIPCLQYAVRVRICCMYFLLCCRATWEIFVLLNQQAVLSGIVKPIPIRSDAPC